jgi:hypothetical protein
MARLFANLVLVLLLVPGENAVALEQPDYEVLATIDGVEFRHYASYLVAEVTVEGSAPDRQAFNILAAYIFGENSRQEKMSMTAPVETRGSDYAFVMEKKYSMISLPDPLDERVRLLERRERIVAVRRFSGRWTEANFAANQRELLAALEEVGVEPAGPPELARYNSPFTLWFLRRNEIMVEVDRHALERTGLIAADT